MSELRTLVDLIEARKEEDKVGITFILNETEERYISYKQMYLTSLRLLYILQESGYKQGDEIIFQIEDNEQFVYSFWACVLGGMIPVPVPVGDNDEQMYKLLKIWDCLNNPRCLISDTLLKALVLFACKNGLNDTAAEIKNNAKDINTYEMQSEKFGAVFRPKPDDLAFIQFSSGSTGDPKGVMITHSNIFINLNAVLRWDHYDSSDSALCWLPFTHDMGLIGHHIKEVLADINQYNMPTDLFLSQPLLWLKKVSDHKVTVLYSPNFGYKQVLKTYDPLIKQDWDLSSVRIIYNGAEPTSLNINNEFIAKMSAYGLKRSSMRPVYGLAESTIAVAFPKIGEEFIYHVLDRNHLRVGQTIKDTTIEDLNAVVYLDVGYPIFDCYVRITNENSEDIGENRIGYVQISGGNVTSGYYNSKKATEEAIGPDGWLNTGDLGFMRNKRLTITGRAKDVIFVSGQNFYSHDIERIAESVKGIELGCVAAVGVYNDRINCDELIAFVKYGGKPENFVSIAVNLKKAINRKTGIEVSEVIPIKDIPKTASGKVQRFKLRESYANGEYDSIKQQMYALMNEKFKSRIITQPATPVQKELVKVWSEVLNTGSIGINDDFFELGGDSLKITQIISRIREHFKVEINQTEVFENPTIEDLAAIIEGAVQNQNIEAGAIAPEIKGQEKTQLSYSQQRLWFLDRLNLSSPQYNQVKGLILKGNLSVEALEKSINAIIGRHEILKAYFVEENGRPVQLLEHEAKIPLKITDLRGVDEINKRTKAEEIARQDVRTPFDLEKAPLIRGNLICLAEKEHILVLVAHHIVIDGWSFGILLKELNFYYNEYLIGAERQLPELKIQYSDFSRWQRNNIESGCIQNQLEYWKKKLEGNLPVLDLPTDKQRPPVQTFNGAKFTSYISAELTAGLQKYARSENTTVFMVLLAAFNVLLYKYSGQTDIIVGMPIANRNRKDIEDLIGFFTNNIILRTGFSESMSFNELLHKVKQVTVEAYSNQDVPFEKIVEELHIERDMSKNPLFQVLFGMQNTPVPAMELHELDVSIMDIDSGYSRFDLAVDVRNTGEGLAADFEYNTSLFNDDTIKRMAGHFNQLLVEIVKDSCLLLDSYDILTAEERKSIIFDWNDTTEHIPEISGWTQLFEKQAAFTPDALAAICGNQQMNYAQLNEYSNRIGQYLRSCGVGPESIVGVYIDRSIDMLAALLGIQKAGAAYLPMDPIFPKDRLEFMLEDADVKIILSEEKLSATLPNHKARVICLDSERNTILQCSAKAPAYENDRNNLAYVIYTSGSTGKPKGVQIEQRSLINLLQFFAQKTAIKKGDSLLAVTTVSFDIAGLELYLPLICGAKVIIAQRNDVTDGKKLKAMLKQYNVTMMQATPETWRLLLEEGWTGSDRLKILCGGEALPIDLAKELLPKCSTLFNVYGPTETTIWSVLDIVEPESKMIHIGKPISNTQIYVVDKSMNPVPIGIPGELLIGGDGLARGYMNLPELTGEKFIPDRFGKKRGALLYKTGDMVKYDSNGKLEFIGRKDNQIKIRGFRIELGEIEALINAEREVKENIVVAKELVPGEKSLVAYIKPVLETVDTESIRKRLKESLPNYMVPSVFLVMKAFPMTSNGKIDRKSLPIPQSSMVKHTGSGASSNGIERQLQEIWRDVLKSDEIDTNSNFFDLGGHSLLMAQVRSKIRTVLNKEISMMDLFKYPTIAALADYIAGNNPEDTGTAEKWDKPRRSSKIAVIGLSGRFPGAKDIDEFWSNLCGGVNSISHFTEKQVIDEGVSSKTAGKPEYVKAWGALDGIELFDAQFFGYNPREAENLDPQQRIFLEESWKALENAGCDTENFKGLVGVYASVGRNTYAQNLEDGGGLANDYQIMISNDKDFLATRIGYKFNLKGPCLTVQTACSSSLVAVHLACQSLLNMECDMALAGGVSIKMPQKAGYLYQEGMILSPDGDCRAFDEKASGTVGGNGAGVVILKRYEDAVADGDNIDAVILGSAINNDGAQKIGYTAPSIDGQATVIEKAQLNAAVDPESITYIEAHGTGTPLGDPIEIEALTQTFVKRTNKKDFCAIGSVKTNIGHLDAAAGVAGLIKTVLSLQHRMIPPSLNYNSPNPKINFKESPFFVNNSLTKWHSGTKLRRAGVSAFGIGGTNAHVILEEAPEFISDPAEDKPLLFTLSAKSKNALDNMTANLADFLERHGDINLADVAYTLQIGRRDFKFRRAFAASSIKDALDLLRNADQYPLRVIDGTADNSNKSRCDIPDNPESCSLEQMGWLWLQGADVKWEKLYKGQRRKRIPLPTYPFEGHPFWAQKSIQAKDETPAGNNKKTGISEWFYTPIWKQSVDAGCCDDETFSLSKGKLLVLKDSGGFSDAFTARLRERHADIIEAVSGNEYRLLDAGKFIFNPERPEHYVRLVDELTKSGKSPVKIVNLLYIDKAENCLYWGERLFYSMMYIAQAIGSSGAAMPIQLRVFTSNAQRIFNESELNPEKSLHLGPCRVIPKEYPNIECCSVDCSLSEPGSVQEHELIDLLINEVYFMPCGGMVAYRGQERWKQDFEKLPLVKSNCGIRFKNGGVYLITGGLGGIGMETAQYIAHGVSGAKLVLAGRSDFPEQEEWDSWIGTHGTKDRTSRKILRLKEMALAGTEIYIYQVDVTEKVRLDGLRKAIIDKYGKIDGIIHAAGKSGGGMIQFKKKEQAQGVINPKVHGAINLYEAFKECKPDFMLLYSSLNAITGGFGQIDYSAANAFLDAFAHAHDNRFDTRIISIDWDRWPGIGMAVNAIQDDDNKADDVHPLLGRCIENSEDKTVYATQMCPENDWVLSEHLVLGIPTVAGTTYLEMARAAFENITGNSRSEISDVLFFNPLSVKQGEKRRVYTVLTKKGAAYDFRILSSNGAQDKIYADWIEHIHGTIAYPSNEKGLFFQLDGLKEKCKQNIVFSQDEQQNVSESFISFGGRWRSLKNFSLGDREGIVEVQLEDAFADDLETFKLHPALLDVATGAVRLAAGGNYLPFAYEKLYMYKTLPKKIYSYIRFRDGYKTGAQIITADIDVISGNGTQLVKITGFSMKLVSETSAENIKNRSTAASFENSATIKLVQDVLKSRENGFLYDGITVSEGLQALHRIMDGCFKSQIIVSTKDINTAIEQADYINQPVIKATVMEAAASKVRHPRPELENGYMPPKNDTEKKLAGLWEDVLCIDKVGINDEFFALGGDSLLLIQFHTRLKETFMTNIAVVDLYKYNTIAMLAKYLNGASAKEEQPAFDEVNSRVTRQKELLKKRRELMLKGKRSEP